MGTKEEQAQILQKVIAASDLDAEEERIVGENGVVKIVVSLLKAPISWLNLN